jgi:hypothetical protein
MSAVVEGSPINLLNEVNNNAKQGEVRRKCQSWLVYRGYKKGASHASIGEPLNNARLGFFELSSV